MGGKYTECWRYAEYWKDPKELHFSSGCTKVNPSIAVNSLFLALGWLQEEPSQLIMAQITFKSP